MRNLKTVETSKGIVEYYEIGTGEVIFCLHGAMGVGISPTVLEKR